MFEVRVQGRYGPRTFFFESPINITDHFTFSGGDAICKCGCKVKRRDYSMYQHLETQKHKSFLEMKAHGIDPMSRAQRQYLYTRRKHCRETAWEEARKRIERSGLIQPSHPT